MPYAFKKRHCSSSSDGIPPDTPSAAQQPSAIPAVAVPPKPFVKWVGGKRNLLRHICSHLPKQFNTYFEPFVGGGAVFFALQHQGEVREAVLSDTNEELVTTYHVIQERPNYLIRRLGFHADHHDQNPKRHFYKVRAQSFKRPTYVAARFIYLNRTCYNGLYRVNQEGKFNTPLGKYTHPNIVQEETINACHHALQQAMIRCHDFSHIEPKAGDFVYLDPPYDLTRPESFTSYTKENFVTDDQVRLRDFVVELDRQGVYVMISNSYTKRIWELYRSFYRHIVHAPRHINCKANGRGPVEELLITNYSCHTFPLATINHSIIPLVGHTYP
jgi:DNA adenine methylase